MHWRWEVCYPQQDMYSAFSLLLYYFFTYLKYTVLICTWVRICGGALLKAQTFYFIYLFIYFWFIRKQIWITPPPSESHGTMTPTGFFLLCHVGDSVLSEAIFHKDHHCENGSLERTSWLNEFNFPHKWDLIGTNIIIQFRNEWENAFNFQPADEPISSQGHITMEKKGRAWVREGTVLCLGFSYLQTVLFPPTPAESVMHCGALESWICNQHFPVLLREDQKEGWNVFCIMSMHLPCIACRKEHKAEVRPWPLIPPV